MNPMLTMIKVNPYEKELLLKILKEKKEEIKKGLKPYEISDEETAIDGIIVKLLSH